MWPWQKAQRKAQRKAQPHNGLSCKAADYHAAMLEERVQQQVVVITGLRMELSRLQVRLLQKQAEGEGQVDDPSLSRLVFYLS